MTSGGKENGYKIENLSLSGTIELNFKYRKEKGKGCTEEGILRRETRG